MFGFGSSPEFWLGSGSLLPSVLSVPLSLSSLSTTPFPLSLHLPCLAPGVSPPSLCLLRLFCLLCVWLFCSCYVIVLVVVLLVLLLFLLLFCCYCSCYCCSCCCCVVVLFNQQKTYVYCLFCPGFFTGFWPKKAKTLPPPPPKKKFLILFFPLFLSSFHPCFASFILSLFLFLLLLQSRRSRRKRRKERKKRRERQEDEEKKEDKKANKTCQKHVPWETRPSGGRS